MKSELRRRIRRTVAAAGSAAILCMASAACAQEPTPVITDDDMIASVNGRGISRQLVDNVRRQLQASGKPNEVDQVLDELINLEVLAQHAAALALDQKPSVAASLRLHRMQTLANVYLAERSASLDFTDEELREEYQRQLSEADIDEYRASHILVESRAAAASVLDALDGGADFQALARRESIDPSAQDGGDLGWFDSASMEPAIIAAVKRLEPGQIAESPVETSFGFHILKLTGTREKPVPDFASVREQIREISVRNALADHVDRLREQADIRRKSP